MSIKKELLDELSLEQLMNLADTKGISFKLSKTQKNYYENWEERDKIVDIMSDDTNLSISEIESFIKKK